jgi:hypothetical protein
MDVNPSEEIKVYDFHSGKNPILNTKPKFWFMGLAFLLFLVLSVYCFETATDKKLKVLFCCIVISTSILLVVFCAIIVLTIISGRITVNVSKQTLDRERYLLGGYQLSRRSFQFRDFNAVVVDQKVGRAKNICYIGLNLLSGQRFWIKHFKNTPDGLISSQAEEFMNELARSLRLPINKTS